LYQDGHRTGWAITQIRKDLSAGPLRQDALIANVDLTNFVYVLEERDMKVAPITGDNPLVKSEDESFFSCICWLFYIQKYQ